MIISSIAVCCRVSRGAGEKLCNSKLPLHPPAQITTRRKKKERPRGPKRTHQPGRREMGCPLTRNQTQDEHKQIQQNPIPELTEYASLARRAGNGGQGDMDWGARRGCGRLEPGTSGVLMTFRARGPDSGRREETRARAGTSNPVGGEKKKGEGEGQRQDVDGGGGSAIWSACNNCRAAARGLDVLGNPYG